MRIRTRGDDANVRRALYLVDRYRRRFVPSAGCDPRDEMSCGGYPGCAESALRFSNQSMEENAQRRRDRSCIYERDS